MRTLSDSYAKNMVYSRDIPCATTKLPGGVVSGFPLGSRTTSSCYVIEEEQPSEEVDNNGNNQRHQQETLCSSNGVDKNADFHKKGKNNIGANSNNKHYATRLLQSCNSINSEVSPSPSTDLPSSLSLCAKSSHGEAHAVSTQVSNKSSFQDHASSSHATDITSRHLVLIFPGNKASLVNPKRESPFFLSSRTLPQRCPVIVKIHDRGYEKYVMISSTKRQLGLSPFCLKLKHTCVTQSASNPSRFTLIVDSSEGKTFTFEASSPDVAREWMQALTLADSSSHWSHPALCSPETSGDAAEQTHHLTNCKSSHAALNLSVLSPMPVLSESTEEDEE